MPFETLASELSDALYEVHAEEPLSLHTTFRIGGRAALYVAPRTMSAMTDLLSRLAHTDMRCRVVGAMSNLLCSDAGFHGVIVTTKHLTNCYVQGHTLVCECGVPLAAAAQMAARAGLSGLEPLSGIPGTVGGALCMNAGAFGRELCDLMPQTTVCPVTGGQRIVLSPSEHGFAYRTSTLAARGFAVLQTTLSLTPANSAEITARMCEVREKRLATQPRGHSAGSVYRRPAPHLSAGALIADLGLAGLREGNAEISRQHAGFIVNLGGATAADVLALIRTTKARVFEATGYRLVCEVEYLRAEETTGAE